jgi:hypothetical protein
MKRLFIIVFLTVFSMTSFSKTESDELWNNDHTAVAFCIVNQVTECFIKTDTNIVNVSEVEDTNLGKIGTGNRESYEKIVTFPERWISSTESEHKIIFVTHAWNTGKRYAAKEIVLVKDGKYSTR